MKVKKKVITTKIKSNKKLKSKNNKISKILLKTPKKNKKNKKKNVKLNVKNNISTIKCDLNPTKSNNVEILPIKKKRKAKTKSKMYFTQDTEDAIVQYNNEPNADIREAIFVEKIYQPLQKLVENIFNTFKFSYFETSPQDVQRECLTHLVANMHKFDPNRTSKTNPTKKSKAYSYFSIIAKHYLILLNNTNYKKFNQNVEIGDDHDENTIQLQQNDKHYAQQEMNDFMKLVVDFWDKNINKIFTKRRDLNIANAVVNLLRYSDRIDAYNKKALYLYIRDMASCKTQQITKIINKMKQYHNNIQESYLNTGIIDTDKYIN